MAKDEKHHTSDNFKSTADLTSNPGFQSSLSVISKNVDEKAYNPFEHRNLEHPNSFMGSILHLLKACIGTGILAMPAAFKNSGFVVGIVGTLLSGVICTHTVHIFVRTSQQVCIDAKKPSMSFAETCGAAFSYGPKRLQPLGEYMKTFMDICMTFTYLAVCSVYVVFIGSSFKEVLDVYYPDLHLSIQTYCALTLVPLVLICQIRNLKYIVPFSAIANFLILIVFSITMYYVFTDLPSIKEREMVADVKQWPLFLSTVVFAMEGIGVVMPVENEMKKPHKFLGCPGVLNVSMVTVISLFTIFGFFGYLQYGDDVRGSITLNLPQDHLIAQSAKLLMAIVIFFSFPIQFYVPIDIISKYLEKKSIKHINLVQIFIRTVIISAIVAVAVLFPNLELAISLVGAIFFSTLGFLTPAIVDTVYHWDKNLGPFNYVLWKNIVIGIISIIALISGSYVSILSMYEHASTDDNMVSETHVNSTLV